uniref:Minor capsid protein P8 central region domain-containing protein n=1 Tax=viral metagenome TaxID=1070528 RepID=A0A6C0J0C0_9ZZZZ
MNNLKKYNDSQTEFYLKNIRNGRVNITGDTHKNCKMPLYEESNRGNHLYKNYALKSIISTDGNKLSSNYFSKKNIDLIQNQLIKKVFIETDYKIKRQSDTELKIIMRSVYLQYSKNIEKNIDKQILELNNLVYTYALPNIVSNLKQFLGYSKDISTLPIPLNLPENLSIKGNK